MHPTGLPSVTSLTGKIAFWFQQAVWQRRAARIKRYSGLNGGNLLDVGCASGDFLKEMERNPKWQGTGIEISPGAASTARQRTRSKIIEQDLLDARLPSAFFDLVTFWDVLEHLPKPLESLHKTYDLLKPGGWMVIRVPDPESLSARLFKQDWVNHDPPRHFHAFPKKLLISRLYQMGFNNVNFHHLTGDYFTFTMSLSIYFSRKKSSGLASLFRSLSQSTILRFLTIPLFILPAWMKMGASDYLSGSEARHPRKGSRMIKIWHKSTKDRQTIDVYNQIYNEEGILHHDSLYLWAIERLQPVPGRRV